MRPVVPGAVTRTVTTVPAGSRRCRNAGASAMVLPAVAWCGVLVVNGPYRVPVYVAARCGLRAGELWALRRHDVDPAARTIRVEWALKEVTGAAGLAVGPPKTQESRRRVSVPAPVMAMLVEHLDAASAPGPKGYPVIKTKGEDHAELSWTDDAADPDRLLFTTPVRPPKDADRWEAVGGFPVRHGQFSAREFRPAVKATLPKFADYKNRQGLRWHDLRHTCASLSLAVSPNLHVVKERLGHKDIRMTINTYGHMVPSVDRARADGLGAMFEADDVVVLIERQALAAV